MNEIATRPPQGTRWYALHTRSRHERRAAAALQRRLGARAEVFLPEYRTWSRRKDRRRELLRPLFPGYLFVRAELAFGVRLDILQADGVVRLVGVGPRPVPVPDEVVDSIRLLLAAAPDARPRERWRPGTRVKVMSGPLAGVTGVVEHSPRGRRIVVAVELLGRAVAASLESCDLAPDLG